MCFVLLCIVYYRCIYIGGLNVLYVGNDCTSTSGQVSKKKTNPHRIWSHSPTFLSLFLSLLYSLSLSLGTHTRTHCQASLSCLYCFCSIYCLFLYVPGSKFSYFCWFWQVKSQEKVEAKGIDSVPGLCGKLCGIVTLGFLLAGSDFVVLSGTPVDCSSGLPLPDKKTLELILDKLQK